MDDSRRQILKTAAIAVSAFATRQVLEAAEAETRDKRGTCPLLVLWGERSIVGTSYDPLRLWRGVATDVRARSLPGGHSLPEELPDQTLAAILEFVPA